ncbi:MAG: efflux RND transporter periplasmic adaptor subunit [Micropepsaceae bacterium]
MPSLKSTLTKLPLPLALGAAGGAMVLTFGLATAILAPAKSEAASIETQSAGLAVTTTEVATARLPLSIPASGTIGAVDEIIIGSEVGGLAISELLVDEGDQVKRGQVLARLNSSILEAQLAQATAQIGAAQAMAAEATANRSRAIELGKRGFASKQLIDQRQAAALSQRAQVAIHAAARDELEARLKQTVIVAPADGIVASRNVAQGQVVGNGTELFRIIRDGKLEWKAELPDHQIASLSEGQAAKLIAGGEAVEGTIRLVSETVDARSRNGVVHVALPAESKLKPGMFARGDIMGGEAEVLTLPLGAVVTRDGESFAFTLAKDGRVQLTKIETGARTAQVVEVRKGLARGARVVLDGAGLLSEGDAVRVTGHVKAATAA